jgi:hypothetical protein
MSIARLACATVLFASGLGVGVLWSPRGGALQTRDSHAVSDVQSESDVRSEQAKFVARIKEMYGDELAEFASQFEDMTIRIKKYPIDAWASPDGRFVIRLFGSDETIVSELRYPARKGGATELLRHYSFSCDHQTYSCDFVRTTGDSKMTEVQFHRSDAKGGELSYVDLDADGRWDRFNDYTRKPPTFYHRDGLFWKERTKDK